MSERTVMINGTAYDAVTGMPIRRQASHQPKAVSQPHPKPEAHHSHAVHKTAQKSQTLNRRIVKNTPHAVKPRPKARPRMDIQKSSAVSKFAPHPQGAKAQPKQADIGPVSHPVVKKAEKRMEMAKKPVAMAPKPAQVIKQEAVNEALEKAPSHSAGAHEVKRKRRYPRVLSVASASLALLLLGGYFTYLNMPSLSTRVAAAQAGINASYPSYRPDGYSLKGAVAYAQHQVNMTFKANSGDQTFTIDQTKSSWDSSAVLENYVSKKVGDNYIAYNERGLTIYTFGGNAAWVNGGILYTINGDAPLSGDQIRHIATSM